MRRGRTTHTPIVLCGSEVPPRDRLDLCLRRDDRLFDLTGIGKLLFDPTATDTFTCYRTFLLKLIIFLNDLCRNFEIVIPGVGPGAHQRVPNGILGLLCNQLYPGLVMIDGEKRPASSWAHYITARDEETNSSRAARVVKEF